MMGIKKLLGIGIDFELNCIVIYAKKDDKEIYDIVLYLTIDA